MKMREQVQLRNGQTVTVRAIGPEDAPRLQALYRRLSPASAFFRFLTRATELSDTLAAKLTHVNGETEMALVATQEEEGQEQIIAVARYAATSPEKPDEAEFAIAVQDDWQRLGLGTLLLHRLADAARARGVRTVIATINPDNERMLEFLRHSEFQIRGTQLGYAEVSVTIDLGEPDEPEPTEH